MRMFIATHKAPLTIMAIAATSAIFLGFQISINIKYEKKAGDSQIEQRQFDLSIRSNQENN